MDGSPAHSARTSNDFPAPLRPWSERLALATLAVAVTFAFMALRATLVAPPGRMAWGIAGAMAACLALVASSLEGRWA